MANLSKLVFSVVVSLMTLAYLPQSQANPNLINTSDAAQRLQNDLSNVNPQRRLKAVEGLSKAGTMKDSNAIVALLKDSDSQVSAAANSALWQIWGRTDSKSINALYTRGTSEMAAGELQKSITTFSQIIRTRPDFAEAWNKRATVYFFTGELQKSIADCDEVIKRNPNHFGALSGYGQIYLQLGQPDQALSYLEKAYAINPTMQSVAEGIAALKRAQERAGSQRI
jgi:tetratricopeptide (TPR) repeat protein